MLLQVHTSIVLFFVDKWEGTSDSERLSSKTNGGYQRRNRFNMLYL